MNWYTDAITKKYADFSGRAHRTEFWMYVLFNFIVAVVLNIVDNMILGMPALGLIYTLGTIVPSIAISVRRLHDSGKPGLYLLLAFVPCLGALILIYFYVQDSQPGSNEYGAQPA